MDEKKKHDHVTVAYSMNLSKVDMPNYQRHFDISFVFMVVAMKRPGNSAMQSLNVCNFYISKMARPERHGRSNDLNQQQLMQKQANNSILFHVRWQWIICRQFHFYFHLLHDHTHCIYFNNNNNKKQPTSTNQYHTSSM